MKRDNLKNFILPVTKIVAFALVFAILLSILSVKVFNGENVAKHSERLADSYSFLKDPEQTVDVAFLGNSDAYSAFNPIALWEEHGITSSVSASAHQTVEECQQALETLTKTQSPKLVVLEVDMLFEGKKIKTDKQANHSKFDYFFDNVAKPDSFENAITTNFSVFTYHNVWKDLEKDEARKHTHGFRCYLKKTIVEPEQYMTVTDETETPTDAILSALKEFMGYCKTNNIPVLFTEVLTMGSWSTPRHNAVQKLADEYGVDFIDFNFMYDELGIDMAKAFRDKGYHVNYPTACVITNYIGSYISEKYGIADHRNDPKYSDYWDNELKCFKETYLKDYDMQL